ncbi:MAG: UPF0149 family protein [Lysobacteraceae bacterium]|nr:MAG: UPF0149 family protein [Xanthomonadaceae bacterium]
MISPDSIDDIGLDKLALLLDERAVPYKGLNLEALDGFVSALMVGPDMVMPSEWQPVVWGGKTPTWRDEEEAREVQRLLMGFWNRVSRRVCHRDESAPLPEDSMPLIWLPEEEPPDDGEAEPSEDAGTVGHDWALGFIRGVSMRENAWNAWIDSEEWLLESYLDIISLVLGKKTIPAEAEDEAPPLTYQDRIEIILDIPWLLLDLNTYRIEAMTSHEPIRRAPVPGRNDPCPCGSGKKYKKCCGA